MRKPCPQCTMKHLAQAEILLNEASLGYPDHYYLAVGHLCEAEAEIIGLNQGVASEIRNARLNLEHDVPLPYEVLMELILELEKPISARKYAEGR